MSGLISKHAKCPSRVQGEVRNTHQSILERLEVLWTSTKSLELDAVRTAMRCSLQRRRKTGVDRMSQKGQQYGRGDATGNGSIASDSERRRISNRRCTTEETPSQD